MKRVLQSYHIRNYNFKLIAYAVILTVIGIQIIGSANRDYQSKQIVGLVAGLIIMVGVSLVSYSFVLRFSWIIYGLAVLLLVLVRFAGREVNNARRWFEFSGVRFQPSEICKVFLILFFAWFFMKFHDHINTVRILLLSLALIAVPLYFIFKQPDLSTTIVTAFIFFALLFIAGLSYKIILGVLAVSIPAAMVLLSLVLSSDQTILNEYQYLRIASWLHPEEYPETAYQQLNSITAIGSGQLFGKGLNNTDVTSVKMGGFISEPQTDFIFAVAGEETGFVGSAAIVILALLITLECILTARKAKDLAGKLICCGMASFIGFQTFVNVGVTTGLLPNTGLPLPFVSYGLTSLVTLFIGLGLVLNVGLQCVRNSNRVVQEKDDFVFEEPKRRGLL